MIVGSGWETVGTRCVTMREFIGVLRDGCAFDIVRALCIVQMNVSTIAHTLKLRQSEVSRSLAPLREFGVVEIRRMKKFHYYRLSSWVHPAIGEGMIMISVVTHNGERAWFELNWTRPVRELPLVNMVAAGAKAAGTLMITKTD